MTASNHNRLLSYAGVFPAITTCFNRELEIDHAFLGRHAQWLIDAGCAGIIALGSLGEGATLNADEKRAIVETLVAQLGGSAQPGRSAQQDVPAQGDGGVAGAGDSGTGDAQGPAVVAGISALSTREAVALARMAEQAGCRGLMVLPPYVHVGAWREMRYHLDSVIGATPLSCMLYNNPVAYGTDFRPEQIAELAKQHPNLEAVKESSTDVRRITAIRALLGDRLQISVGVDDLVVEGVQAGATGWVAGLVNALPRESVELFELAMSGADPARLFELYAWFLPLLRLDTVPELVQLIKLVQVEVEMGTAYVRPPRLELIGERLAQNLALIRQSLSERP